ncbi:CopG family ribbon-helix-helix protein [Candidatus Micrarchaeota archaeon]|nr:CopG family ribbon-helix-helix protein [Candidatus Micrarchaeota archaeon]
MPIISISLNEKMLSELDSLQKELGFSGRSEIIRAGVRNLIAENKEKEKLYGNVKAVLIIVHDEKAESTVTEIKHEFEEVLDTQVHSKLKDEKCLEIFIVDGDAPKVKALIKKIQASKKVDYAKLIVT